MLAEFLVATIQDERVLGESKTHQNGAIASAAAAKREGGRVVV